MLNADRSAFSIQHSIKGNKPPRHPYYPGSALKIRISQAELMKSIHASVHSGISNQLEVTSDHRCSSHTEASRLPRNSRKNSGSCRVVSLVRVGETIVAFALTPVGGVQFERCSR